MAEYEQGTRIVFTYTNKNGETRERDMIVDEMRMTGKGMRIMAFPNGDSLSGREGPRTLDPEGMSNVRVMPV